MSLKVGIVQQACTSDREVNLTCSLDGLRICKERGADLAILPELHASLYFCQREDVANFDLAESIPDGPTLMAISSLSRELGLVVVASVFERRAPGLYHNTAVVFEKTGTIAGIYRKMHIPDDPSYYEKFYFSPGDLGFQPIVTSVGVLGVLVCWDQWFPEAARLMAMRGAEILIYPTAIGYARKDAPQEQQRQREAWITVQRGHAIANGLPVVTVNRVGFEGAQPTTGDTEGVAFWGHSFFCGAQGELLYQAMDEPTVAVIEWPQTQTESVRRIWPFFRDRRIDAYHGLDKRFLV